jgi:6,7-dimethyl-8-ribityllumazine synthase
MAAHVKGLAPATSLPDASALRVAIVAARWNQTVTSALVEGARYV